MKVSKMFQYKTYPEEELRAIIKHLFRNKDLSNNSVTQYAIKIQQWVSYIKDNKTIQYLIENPSESIQCLEETPKIKHSAANHHIYISSVIAFIKYILKDETLLSNWKEYERKNWEPIAKRYDENKPSDIQSNKLMTLTEIETIRQTLEKGSVERLLLSFYTLIEPIRADYYATEIIQITAAETTAKTTAETAENYIILPTVTTRAVTGAKLVVRNFKTSKKYEKIENTLSIVLEDELRASLEMYPRKYVFVMEDKKSPFTRKLFSNWACRTLTRVLKQQMPLTALRHIYITNKIQSNKTTTELVEIAKKMGHSRDIQRVYEWR